MPAVSLQPAAGGPIYDAIVVGGGPAGCSAAISLAAQGARVLLFEARPYPHAKLCGEFLSPECAGLLDELGLSPALRALKPALIDVASLSAPDGTRWETRLPGAAWGLTRRALDAALAERAQSAGVEVRPATTVTGIWGDLAAGFKVEAQPAGPERGQPQTARARTVVGAHGKRAALDRTLDRNFLRRPQPFVALKAHFQGPPLPGRIELHAFPGGYCGMSEIESVGIETESGPGGPVANVCLLAHETALRQAGAVGPERVPAFIQWMQRQNPRLEAWLAHARPLEARWTSVAQVPFGDKRAVVADILMAGDAAGLIVPLAGDGIAMALRGGQLAARWCAAALSGRQTPAEVRHGYARAWRREFGSRLRLGRLLQACLLQPRWVRWGLRLLNAAPALGQYFVTHTRDVRLVPGARPLK